MNTIKDETAIDVSDLASKQGIRYPVKVSGALSKVLKPNEFLAGLGIRFLERMDNILDILQGRMIPKNGGPAQTIPDDGLAISLTVTQGPFIREIPVSIWAELHTDDDGEEVILLTVIQDEDDI